MSFILREYQSRHINEVMKLLPHEEKVLLQLPTGGGKTVMFSLITQSFLHKYGEYFSAVLILVHRKELMNQAAKTIKDITGITPVLINQDAKKYKSGSIYIAMVDSLIRRMHLISGVGLVIIDECHIGSFNKTHPLFKTQFFIGVSATPISSSKKDPLKNYYNVIIPGVQIPELINSNFLSQNITRVPKNFIDTTKFKVNPLTGDYDEKELSQEYQKARNIKNTVEAYKKYNLGKKTIVFNININHSISVNEEFVVQGFNSKHLDSNDKNRDEILKWFKETPDAILNNVMIATVGYDEPTIRAVILNFDTLSLPKFLQTCGRGGRIINDTLALELNCSPKFKFDIIDMGSNAIRFGDWSDERDWNDIFNNPDKPPKAGNPPKKVCPSCSTLVHLAIRICECGHEFEFKGTGEENELGDFVTFTKNVNIENLNMKETTMEERLNELDIKVKDLMNLIYNNEKLIDKDKLTDMLLDLAYSLKEQEELRKKLQPKRFNQLLSLINKMCHDLIINNDILEKGEMESFKERFVEPYLKPMSYSKTREPDAPKPNYIKSAIDVTTDLIGERKNKKDVLNGISEKSEQKKLKVTFPDGYVIEDYKAVDTYLKTFQRIGLQKIISLNISNGDPLVIRKENFRNDLKKKYKQTPDGNHYILTNNNTVAKGNFIERISEIAGLNIKVELVNK